MAFAPEINKGLNDFQFEIGRRKSVVMLDADMDHKLTSKSADSHGLDI